MEQSMETDGKGLLGELKMLGMDGRLLKECINSIQDGNARWESLLMDYRKQILEKIHKERDTLSMIDMVIFKLRQEKQ